MSFFPSKTLDVTQSIFGQTPDGSDVILFSLNNAQGMKVNIINFGGIITELYTPDHQGIFSDIVLGFDQLQPYFNNEPYFGALIGRYANRIANGEFHWQGHDYQLPINNGNHHLHGGFVGFDKVIWQANSFSRENSVGVILRYISSDGEQGYPGNVQVDVIYELTNNNEIVVKFSASTDQVTPINLTQHTYFNLTGFANDSIKDILEHRLELNAEKFIPIDKGQIPIGKLKPVADTAFDFRRPHSIGERIEDDDLQLKNGYGYDHTFVLNKSSTDIYKELRFAARVLDPYSGRVLELFTDQPGVQFYSGNFLTGSFSGKGHIYSHRSGFCLEPQHFPDSPNQPQFPTTFLWPDTKYSSTILYKFSIGQRG